MGLGSRFELLRLSRREGKPAERAQDKTVPVEISVGSTGLSRNLFRVSADMAAMPFLLFLP